VIEKDWIERVRRSLPELPSARFQRFQKQYELNGYDANLLISEQDVAVYFEQAAAASPGLPPKTLANWILGDFVQPDEPARRKHHPPADHPGRLAELVKLVSDERVNAATARNCAWMRWR